MAKASISDVLSLLGGPGLDDGATDARQRFRAFLCQPKWSPDDLQHWVDECLEIASRVHSEFYFALQDIITSIGSHLGFEVEFGSYAAAGVAIPYDGKWRAITGETILIEVKSSPWPLGSISQLGGYIDQFALLNRCGPDQVFGVYAIGSGDFSALIDQIKGSEYRNRIKVISFADLLRLLSLRHLLDQQMPAERVVQVLQNLLLPFESVNIGSIIEIIQGVAVATFEESGAQPCKLVENTGTGWRRTEFRDFLDGCQPAQVALLLALCSSDTCELSGEGLVSRMRHLSPVVPGLDENQLFSHKTIGGARSGLSKREQQMNKDSVLECGNGSYRVREDYREWVTEWLKDRGLLPLPALVGDDLGGLFAEPRAAAAAD